MFRFPIISSTFITKSVSGITPMGMRSTRLTPISVVDIKINTFYASLFLEEVFICFLCLCHYISGCLYRVASAFILYFELSVKKGVFRPLSWIAPNLSFFNVKIQILWSTTASQRFYLALWTDFWEVSAEWTKILSLLIFLIKSAVCSLFISRHRLRFAWVLFFAVS